MAGLRSEPFDMIRGHCETKYSFLNMDQDMKLLVVDHIIT